MWKTTIELPIEMLKVKFTGRIILGGGYRLVDPLLIPDNHWTTFSSACKPRLDSRRSSIWFIFGYTYTFCGKDMLGGQSGGNKEQFTTKYKMGSRAQKKSFFINTISTNTNIWKTIISKEIIRNAKS